MLKNKIQPPLNTQQRWQTKDWPCLFVTHRWRILKNGSLNSSPTFSNSDHRVWRTKWLQVKFQTGHLLLIKHNKRTEHDQPSCSNDLLLFSLFYTVLIVILGSVLAIGCSYLYEMETHPEVLPENSVYIRYVSDQETKPK